MSTRDTSTDASTHTHSPDIPGSAASEPSQTVTKVLDDTAQQTWLRGSGGVRRAERQRLWAAFVMPHFALEALLQGERSDAGYPGVAQVAGSGHTPSAHASVTAPAAEQPPRIAVTSGGSAPRVLATDTCADTAGIAPGMTLSAALAVQPKLHALVRRSDIEQDTLSSLAAWAQQYTSMVVPMRQEPVGLLLEVGASQRLFGDARRLVRRVADGLAALGFMTARAIAPTPAAAWLLARAGQHVCVIQPERLRTALDPVPTHCLDLDADAVTALAGIGLNTLADCWQLPRAETARRVGPAFWQQLDRALGRIADPRRPYKAPERLRQRLLLPGPVVGVEALLFALGRLLRQTEGVLIARGSAVQLLQLELGLTDGSTTRAAVELITPSRDVKHLLGLLKHRLEAMRLSEPVEQIALEALQCVSLAPRNLDLFDNRVSMEDEWATTLERLHARLGPERVQGVAMQPEHRPEYAWRPVSVSAASGGAGGRQPTSVVTDEAVPGLSYHGEQRPLWLLAEPCHLQVRDGVPCYGGPLALQTSAERIEGGWWEGQDVSRDYHIATNEAGERYWVYHDRHQRGWYLHGVFS
ncbi:MAG: DNA polymerase Y family protein [Pseudomonadota bacterium]